MSTIPFKFQNSVRHSIDFHFFSDNHILDFLLGTEGQVVPLHKRINFFPAIANNNRVDKKLNEQNLKKIRTPISCYQRRFLIGLDLNSSQNYVFSPKFYFFEPGRVMEFMLRFSQACYLMTRTACLVRVEVEEKFDEQNFQVLSEMRGKMLYVNYNPKKIKILDRNWMKIHTPTLPKFEISIF